jgi:hypothetical protein
MNYDIILLEVNVLKKGLKQIDKEETILFKGLTENQKKKYLLFSNLFFIGTFLLTSVLGVWFAVLFIEGIKNDENILVMRDFASGSVLIVMSVFELFEFIKSTKEYKIMSLYKFIHNRVVIVNKGYRLLMWFAILSIFIICCVPFFNKGSFDLFLFVIAIAGFMISLIVWYSLLSKRKDSKSNDGNIKEI